MTTTEIYCLRAEQQAHRYATTGPAAPKPTGDEILESINYKTALTGWGKAVQTEQILHAWDRAYWEAKFRHPVAV